MSDTKKTPKGWTDAEKAAMKERAKEQKAEARATRSAADGEKDLLAKVAEMPDADRKIAERIHAMVRENAPHLSSKTWYGMPAYANKEGKVVCFFQAADKFKARYATFGFSEDAKLDDGTMWPTTWALMKLTADSEAKIAALIKKAAS